MFSTTINKHLSENKMLKCFLFEPSSGKPGTFGEAMWFRLTAGKAELPFTSLFVTSHLKLHITCWVTSALIGSSVGGATWLWLMDEWVEVCLLALIDSWVVGGVYMALKGGRVGVELCMITLMDRWGYMVLPPGIRGIEGVFSSPILCFCFLCSVIWNNQQQK